MAILGVWDFLDGDVIDKSFQTVALLAFVTIVLVASARFMDAKKGDSTDPQVLAEITQSKAMFANIRHITLSIFIGALGILALLGVLSIWEVVGGDVMSKSLSSIAVLGFSALIVLIACLLREDNPALVGGSTEGKMSITRIILTVLFVILVLPPLLFFLMGGLFFL